MHESLLNLNAQGIEMAERINSLKNSFAEAVADKSIPLNDRWAAFERAPSFLKEHALYIVHFNCLDEDAISYEGWLRHAEKYQVIHTAHIIENLLEHEDFLYHLPGEDTYKLNEKGKAIYNALREEILERNLGSFEYDW